MILTQKDVDVSNEAGLIFNQEKMLLKKIEKTLATLLYENNHLFKNYNKYQKTFSIKFHCGDWDNWYTVKKLNNKIFKRKIFTFYGGNTGEIKTDDLSSLFLLKRSFIEFLEQETIKAQARIEEKKILLEALK